MNPRDITYFFDDWITANKERQHSQAVKYIQDNMDMLDTNLEKFLEGCPRSCATEVVEMLEKAGVDVTYPVIKATLKQYDQYLWTSDKTWQKFAVEYKTKLDTYIEQTLSWKPEWHYDTVEEA